MSLSAVEGDLKFASIGKPTLNSSTSRARALRDDSSAGRLLRLLCRQSFQRAEHFRRSRFFGCLRQTPFVLKAFLGRSTFHRFRPVKTRNRNTRCMILNKIMVKKWWTQDYSHCHHLSLGKLQDLSGGESPDKELCKPCVFAFLTQSSHFVLPSSLHNFFARSMQCYLVTSKAAGNDNVGQMLSCNNGVRMVTEFNSSQVTIRRRGDIWKPWNYLVDVICKWSRAGVIPGVQTSGIGG